MPINVLNTPYKLKPKHRKALTSYLTGQAGLEKTATAMGVTRQRVYTMSAVIFKHAASSGKIDIQALIKDY